jgi:uncharacterized protein YjbI with pentapeptide repeats
VQPTWRSRHRASQLSVGVRRLGTVLACAWRMATLATGSTHDPSGRCRLERLFTNSEKRSLQGLRLTHTCFDHADFSRADLSGAVFDSVSLVGCDLRGAILTLATFHCCDLRDALFDRSTVLRGSRFAGSILLGARGLSRSGRLVVHRSGGILVTSVQV